MVCGVYGLKVKLLDFSPKRLGPYVVGKSGEVSDKEWPNQSWPIFNHLLDMLWKHIVPIISFTREFLIVLSNFGPENPVSALEFFEKKIRF